MKKKCDDPERQEEHEAPMFEELDVINPVEALDGPMQMAVDEVLLSCVRRPTLRVYRWEAPCVTYGYFQPYALVESLHPGLPSVRRWTGGGIVVHGEDLTFSLMIPPCHPVSGFSPSRFYHELHGAVANAFGGQLAGDGEISDGPSCFSAPSRDDLMIGGRKVLGGAIRRSGRALLYQGSLMDRDRPDGAIPEILASAICRKHLRRILEAVEISSARVLSQGRYATQAWNLRR